ncbi:MAG TPA: aspartyl protease family protein, partial [Sphingomicrobium sp.]|nr:aspartyl protease family protein [Sphingomicrobium sp.]
RRRIFLPLYLNGKGPFTFELDNGSHFILTEETAKALGLAAKGSFSSTGAGNQIATTGYVMVDKLRIGSAELVKQPAKVLALSHNDRGGSSPRAGILGLEFFERFVVGVDHRRKIVTLRLVKDPPSRHLGRAVPLLFDEDAPLVAGSYEGVPGMVMLDIGNAGATIVEDYWAGEHGLRPKLSAGVPKGSAKLSKARIGLGPFVLEDETAAYLGQAERGSEYTRSVAAIIGEPLLSRFDAVYDYGHRTVWLDPIPGAGAVDFDLRR